MRRASCLLRIGGQTAGGLRVALTHVGEIAQAQGRGATACSLFRDFDPITDNLPCSSIRATLRPWPLLILRSR
jgi:hypothetical protein